MTLHERYPPVPEPLEPLKQGGVVDDHTHLDGLPDHEVDGLLVAAAAAGVPRAVQIGCDLPAARWTVRAVDRWPQLLGGVAIHPNEAPLLAARGELDAALAEVEAIARSSERIRVVGEPGRFGQLALPTEVVSSEFLTMEGGKFSSSRGVVIYVRDVLARYQPDALRYYIAAAGPENQDADFTWEQFRRRTNDELVSTWGNLVNRTASMIAKNVGSIPPAGALSAAVLAALGAGGARGAGRDGGVPADAAEELARLAAGAG